MMVPATFVWLFAAAAAVFIFARTGSAGARPYRPFSPGFHAAVAFSLALAVAGYAFFNVKLDDRDEAGGFGELLFQDGNAHGVEPGGFWTKGGRGATVLVRASRPLSRISVTLTSPVVGRTSVRAGMSERIVVRPARNGPAATADFDAPVGFRRGDGYLYCLRIEDSARFVPHALDGRSSDGRDLGVLVSVSAVPVP